MNNSILPQSVKNTLWSYDTDKIDLQKNKQTVVSQVLNFGNKDATDWLVKTYGENQIAQIANNIPLGQWDKKSLALWSLVFNIKPKSKSQRIADAK